MASQPPLQTKKAPLERGRPDWVVTEYGESKGVGYKARNESMLAASTAKAPNSSASSLPVKGASASFMLDFMLALPQRQAPLCISTAPMLGANTGGNSKQFWK